MSKRYVAALASLVVWASCTLGQAPEPAPAPAPDAGPAPAAEPPPVPSLAGWDELKAAFLGQPAHQGGGVFTAQAEYLLYFLANSRNSSAVASTGVLGTQGTTVIASLADPEHGKREPSSGARFTAGYWQIENNPWVPGGIRDVGVETTLFFVGQRHIELRNNDMTTNLVRPFFDLNNRMESSFLIAAPGVAAGSLSARSQVDIWGAEANLWKNVYYNCPGTTFSVDLMAGFRFLDYDSQIQAESISDFLPNLATTSPFFALAGNRLQVFDSFTTHNRFYGGQVGIHAKFWPLECLTLEGGFKAGLGVTAEDLTIVGGQLRTFPNGTQAAASGGLLALPTNMGHFTRDKFTQVPELDFKISAPILNHLTLSTGFSALYWNRLARPGQQVDRELDITQIPNFPPGVGATPTGLPRPGVAFRQSDLWVLGLSVGAEFSW